MNISRAGAEYIIQTLYELLGEQEGYTFTVKVSERETKEDTND